MADERPTLRAGLLPNPRRPLAAVFATGAVLLALWQAGVLFDRESTSSTVEGLALAPADTSVATPNGRGLTVGLREGDLAPDFEFSAFDGRRLRLSEFRGKAVFLNFWATWCGPCRFELPDMQTVLERFEADGLAVIAVNFGERYERAARYLDEIDVRLTAFAFDPEGAIARSYDVQGMPTSYFIDATGRITRVVLGQLTPRLMESSVRDALNGYAVRLSRGP